MPFESHEKDRLNKNFNQFLSCPIYDTDAKAIIERIRALNIKLPLPKVHKNFNLVSTTNDILRRDLLIHIERFQADVDLVGLNIYVNKKLSLDCKTILTLLSAYDAQMHLENWPSHPDIKLSESIEQYRYKVQVFEKELLQNLQGFFEKILTSTNLKRDCEIYYISHATNPNVYFGVNNTNQPNYRCKPISPTII